MSKVIRNQIFEKKCIANFAPVDLANLIETLCFVVVKNFADITQF